MGALASRATLVSGDSGPGRGADEWARTECKARVAHRRDQEVGMDSGPHGDRHGYDGCQDTGYTIEPPHPGRCRGRLRLHQAYAHGETEAHE